MLLCLSCMAVHIYAQSLDDAISIAKRNAIDAQIARKTFAYSRLAYEYYKAGRKPALSLNSIPIQYNTDVVQRYSYDEDRTYYRTQNSLYSTANLRVMQNIEFLGGTIYLDSDLRFYKSLGSNSYKQFTTIPLRLGYSQSLIGYNVLKWQKKIEPLGFVIAEKSLLHNLEHIATETMEKYLAVALLREELLLAEDNLRNCDTLCMEGKAKLRLGCLTNREFAELELERSKAHIDVQQADMNIKEAEAVLRNLLRLSPDDSICVSMPDVPCLQEIPLDKALEYATDNSIDMLTSKKDIIEAQQNVARLRTKRYFDASINASVGLHQISEKFSSSYHNLLNEQMVSVSMTIPLDDFGRGRLLHVQAKEALDKQKLIAEKTKSTLEENIMQCVLKHPLLYNMIGSTSEAYRLSCETYNDVLAEYRLGRWSMNSLSNAIINRQTMLIAFYRAIYNYLENYLQIRNMTLFDFEKQQNITYIID